MYRRIIWNTLMYTYKQIIYLGGGDSQKNKEYSTKIARVLQLLLSDSSNSLQNINPHHSLAKMLNYRFHKTQLTRMAISKE